MSGHLSSSRKKKSKRKKGSSTDSENLTVNKVFRAEEDGGPTTGSSDIEDSVTVSEILNTANAVLHDSPVFDEYSCTSAETVNTLNNTSSPTEMSKSASEVEGESGARGPESPTNAELLTYLKRMDAKIDCVDSKLKKLDVLEKKVDMFEKEIKSLWVRVHEAEKVSGEKFIRLEDRVENIDMASSSQTSRVEQLEKESCELKSELQYVKSQQMRNNLVFGGIPETPKESWADTEKTLRQHFVEKLGLAQEVVDSLKLERVHRMGAQDRNPSRFYNRKIVAKFCYFKDRELIRQQRGKYEGTGFYMHEQYPPEVVAKRRKLVPKMKKAKEEGKRAWISYDTLYVDGQPVRD